MFVLSIDGATDLNRFYGKNKS